MHNILSTSISWRSWRDFMTYAHEQLELPPTKFVRPTGVEERELCWPSGRLPSELCPRENRYSGLFAADVLPRDEEELAAMVDTWWQLVRIDTRTGLRATATTPSTFVAEEVRLVLPEEEIQDWKDLPEWAAANGLVGRLAPPEESTAAGALVSVISPVAAQTVFGQLQIRGRADAPAIQRFAVEWGRGSSPDVWVQLRASDRPVGDGVLASWSTTSVPNGAYTVRVVVDDARLGRLRFAVPVTVDNGAAGAPVDLAPWGQITRPAAGAVVSGTVVVAGSALSGDLLDARLEVGAGLSPTSWIEVGRFQESRFSGTLGSWDTTAVADGTYTLRLTVRDRQLGLAEITTTLAVQNEADE